MISKNELRLGNAVYGVSDRIETIHELLDECCTTKLGDVADFTDYGDISGIPLSEDVLISIGFEKSDRASDTYGGWLSPKTKNGSQMRLRKDHHGWYYTVSIHSVIYLDFIHSLQNLFFVMSSGEELTYKP